jgi:ADP-L-glycero-D-manno-heptose 6-epimerase
MEGGMRILVTGGLGLIGNAIVRALNKRNLRDIWIVDRLGNCRHKWEGLSRVRIRDYLEVEEFDVAKIPSPDIVIHQGARSHTTETNAAFLIRNNYRFSQDLARWCKTHGARFVYASSAATYGADTALDDCAPIDSLRPLNPYGLSKQLFDQWMTHEGWLDEGWAAGLKYFNVYGPFERHKGEQRSLVCKAYDALCVGKPIELFESARPDVKTEDIRRDFIYVEDAAKITVWFALDDKGREAHGLFNVGSGVATSFTDLARYTSLAYVAAHGKPIPPKDAIYYDAGGKIEPVRVEDYRFPYTVHVPMPEQLRARYQYYTCAPITKLRAAGYTEPFKSVEEGVREYVCDYLAKEIE